MLFDEDFKHTHERIFNSSNPLVIISRTIAISEDSKLKLQVSYIFEPKLNLLSDVSLYYVLGIRAQISKLFIV